MREPHDLLEAALPGAELIRLGLADLRRSVESVEGLLVAIARPRLQRLGIDVPPLSPAYASPSGEIRLYRLLCREVPEDAYGRYNALLRRLVSFEHALEHHVRWAGARLEGCERTSERLAKLP